MNHNQTHKAVIVKVFGRVQGVGFRFYTQKKARELNLHGYVQNKPDGSVYIEAEGEDIYIEQFMLWCEKGPSWARVSRIETQYIPLQNFSDFKIR